MNRYQEINQQYELCRTQLKDLMKEYEGKIKGDIFIKRKTQLRN